ncbi:MAG TPA: FAD binding domain-containing protein [Candidatus Sulfotelmatobacter sp.]|nr:FAD binding domain-containing protein [Candidatus Sulfotelmatobacter sp.]
MQRFELIDARSLQEASSLLKKHGAQAQPLAGGGDLLYLMKDYVEGPRLKSPTVLVNLESIPGTNTIKYERGKGLVLGATALIADIEADKTIQEKYPVIHQAAAEVASPQLRNMGTLGGNLCQKPRCWYYRNQDIVCLKKGGDQCWAINGDNRYYHAVLEGGPCHIVSPSDMAPALIAAGATVHLFGGKAARSMPLEKFFVTTRESLYQETVLAPAELVAEVRVPEPKPGTRSAYVKARIRGSWDFALASAGVSLRAANGVVQEARVCLGGVSPRPYRAEAAEKALVGKKVDEATAKAAAEAALADAKPMTMNAYKVDLAKAVLKRAILEST